MNRGDIHRIVLAISITTTLGITTAAAADVAANVAIGIGIAVGVGEESVFATQTAGRVDAEPLVDAVSAQWLTKGRRQTKRGGERLV